MRKIPISLVLAVVMLSQINVFAVNAISIRNDLSHVTKPGYIQSATLVIEPHDAYAEQSLYVTYTDKNQYSGSNVEIIHSFDLPSGSTVNDLWLWIGDSVMQAKIIKKSTARHIYDSITSFKRDPAFLNVVDEQYELRVYPLESGKTRKIKMTMMSEIQHIGTVANIYTPCNFLRSNNNSTTRLRILFRYDNRLTYVPKILENKDLTFDSLPDTLNWHYKECNINDIQKYKYLTITYEEPCTSGVSVKLGKADHGFISSIGINPIGMVVNKSDSSQQRNLLIGHDLSGMYGFDKQAFKEEFKSFLTNYLKSGDSLKVLIAGGGLYDTLPQSGVYVSSETNVNSITNAVCSSQIITSKQSSKKIRILFADSHARGCWFFSELESIAQCSTASDLQSCLYKLNDFDVVAAYEYGYEHTLSNDVAEMARSEIMKYMKSGGMFLCYYDTNRENEKIASVYVKGLRIRDGFASDLTRNINGNIGSLLPESFYHYSAYPLIHFDDSAVNELTNKNGDPVVVSKKYGEGMLIVSGLWTFHDDDALKQQVNTALLGLQKMNKNAQLKSLINIMANTASAAKYDECVLISNSDELVTSENITQYINEIDTNKLKNVPPTYCISLLDGQSYSPPFTMIDQNKYYGSEYLLANVSKMTGGNFFSTLKYDMGAIGVIIENNIKGIPNNIIGSIFCDGLQVHNDSIFAINALAKAGIQYLLAKCDSCDTISVAISGTDSETGSTIDKKYVFKTNELYKENGNAFYTAYSIQTMRKLLLAEQLDSMAIIDFAIKNRLLNDFTAFLAIEPNDSNFFMRDPFDESQYKTPTRTMVNRIQSLLSVVIKSNLLQYSLSGFGKLEIRFFDLSGKCVYSKAFTCSGHLNNSIDIKNLRLAGGTYIAVAKFITSDKNDKNKPITKITRFVAK